VPVLERLLANPLIMTTDPGITICPDCGEDLAWHDCRANAIRDLNDALRTSPRAIGVRLACDELVITHGVAAKGNAFIDRAMKAVREFSNFTEDNDPDGQHDFGIFELDGISLNWKIDCYDRDLKYGSADPSDPEKTRRVLTILLAEEY
jgi:uncharacterized protein DUF3768